MIVFFLTLHLLFLPWCGSFLSPAARPPQRRGGWCCCFQRAPSLTPRSFSPSIASSAIRAHQAAAGDTAPGGRPEPSIPSTDARAERPSLSCVSAVLSDYPRSPYSKVALRRRRETTEKENSETAAELAQAQLPEKQFPVYGPLQSAIERGPSEMPPSSPPSEASHELKSAAAHSASSSSLWLCAGRVGGAHGLKGHLKIVPSTFAVVERFCSRESRLFFCSRGSLSSFVSRAVEEGRLLQRSGKSQVALVKLRGIDDRVAANSLAGSLVYVHSTQSHALLPPKSLLAAELVDFEVTLLHDPDRTRIGRVSDVISKHAMRLRQEALGAADDCLQIEVYRDLPGRRLLLDHYHDPAPPPSPLVASALHALGEQSPEEPANDEAPLLFACETCGLRFTDCTAAVCHERVCLAAANKSRAAEGGFGAARKQGEEEDALLWLLQSSLDAAETTAASETEGSLLQQPPRLGGGPPGETDTLGAPPTLLTEGGPLREGGGAPFEGRSCLEELQTLEGPGGRAGQRLGSRFFDRLSLGDRVSWERGGRFFPRRGEASDEAAERALEFACKSSRNQREYTEADWNEPAHVAAIATHLTSPTHIHPAACDAEGRPNEHSFLLPFVLGVTVGDADPQARTLGINAPPALIH
ncbi:hypothetical protein Esti_001715 [Eimeria stiedai]